MTPKIVSAKKLGFKKGDMIYTGSFPGILISDVHTTTPVVEVWGYEQEMGSVYARDLSHIDSNMFLDLAAKFGHDLPLTAHSKVAKKALEVVWN